MSIEKVVGLSKEVVLANGEKIVVKKLPLGEYAKLMFTLKNLPSSVMKEFQNIDTENTENTISSFFGIFGEAWGQLIEILAIGTGIAKERLENDEAIGLDGAVELFVAVYEVNNLNGVIKSVKNVIAGAKN